MKKLLAFLAVVLLLVPVLVYAQEGDIGYTWQPIDDQAVYDGWQDVAYFFTGVGGEVMTKRIMGTIDKWFGIGYAFAPELSVMIPTAIVGATEYFQNKNRGEGRYLAMLWGLTGSWLAEKLDDYKTPAKPHASLIPTSNGIKLAWNF